MIFPKRCTFGFRVSIVSMLHLGSPWQWGAGRYVLYDKVSGMDVAYVCLFVNHRDGYSLYQETELCPREDPTKSAEDTQSRMMIASEHNHADAQILELHCAGAMIERERVMGRSSHEGRVLRLAQGNSEIDMQSQCLRALCVCRPGASCFRLCVNPTTHN